MDIEVNNPSSAGASFTEHTDNSYLMYYNEFLKEPEKSWNFNELRHHMEIKYNINNSNSRNMFALLKDCQFVQYEKGNKVSLKSFFTKYGLAYAKVLESLNILKDDMSEKNKEEAYYKFIELKENLICHGVQTILLKQESSFSSILKYTLEYLVKYRRIDKIEYALVIFFTNQGKNIDDSDLKNVVEKYRNKEIDINVKVNTRNDNSSVKGERILQDIGALTSYTYICGFLQQAGLIEKEKTSFLLLESKVDLAKKMIKGEYDVGK